MTTKMLPVDEEALREVVYHLPSELAQAILDSVGLGQGVRSSGGDPPGPSESPPTDSRGRSGDFTSADPVPAGR